MKRSTYSPDMTISVCLSSVPLATSGVGTLNIFASDAMSLEVTGKVASAIKSEIAVFAPEGSVFSRIVL